LCVCDLRVVCVMCVISVCVRARSRVPVRKT
jgi:hypothetical protein